MADDRKDLPSASATNWAQRVNETLRTYMGKAGPVLDRGVTVRDLVNAGIADLKGGSNFSGLKPGSNIGQGAVGPQGPPGPAVPYEPDLTPPPTPTGFTAVAAISNILLEHAVPGYTQGHGHGRTRVYGATWISGALPTFSAAVEITQFTGTVFAHATNPATTWHLWIKWESADGVLSTSPAGGANGVAVTTGQDVSKLVAAMTGPGNPFKVVTVSTTLPDGSVVPAGTYTADAFIHNGQITNAKIANLAVDNAKIANLSVSKLTAGSIAVGQYIQSTSYVAGSAGWRINGDGTAEFAAASIRGQLVAAQINTNGLDIRDGSGNVVFQSGIKVSQQVAQGGNLIPNADLQISQGSWTVGYVQNPGQPHTIARDLSGDAWRPTGGHNIGIERIVSPYSLGVIDAINDVAIPVMQGTRYEISGRVAAHRCNANIAVAFYNSSGAYVSEGGATMATRMSGGVGLVNWELQLAFVTAPVNAAFAKVFLRSYGSDAGTTSSYAWLTQPMFCIAGSGQTTASTWSASNFVERITAANASTYIANAAIGNAQIGNAAIGTAQIQNLAVGTAQIANAAINNAQMGSLAVDTINLAGNAVTIPVSAFSAGYISISASAWTTVQSLSLNTDGSPVFIAFSQLCTVVAYIRIVRDGTVLYDTTASTYLTQESGSLADYPPAGYHTYYLQVGNYLYSGNSYLRSLFCMAVKR